MKGPHHPRRAQRGPFPTPWSLPRFPSPARTEGAGGWPVIGETENGGREAKGPPISHASLPEFADCRIFPATALAGSTVSSAFHSVLQR